MHALMVPVAQSRATFLRVIPIVLGLAFASPSNLAQPRREHEPVIRVNVNLVQLPVRVVSRAGANIVDLQKQDFRVLENGVEQEVGFLLSADHPVHVALVVDTSGSTIEHLPMLKKAAREFVDHFGPQDHIALYEIGPQVVRVVPFSLEHKLVKKGISTLETSNRQGSAANFPGAKVLQDGKGKAGTLLYDGVVLARQDFPAAAQRRAILVFTDAQDHGSRASFRLFRWLTLRGNEAMYAVLPKQDVDADWLLQQMVVAAGINLPMKPSVRVARSSKAPRNSFASSTWALILDLSATDDEDIHRFQAIAKRFLEELQPEAHVWLFDYRHRLRVLALPDEDGRVPTRPVSPLEAQHLLDMASSVDRAPESSSSGPVDVRADRVLILSDKHDAGVQALFEAMNWNPYITAILHPEEIANEAEGAKLIQTVVHDPLGTLEISAQSIGRLFQRVMDQFHALAADTGGSAFVIKKPKELQAVYARVAREIRSSYTLGYYTKGIPGQHPLSVQLPGRDALVQSRRWVVIQ